MRTSQACFGNRLYEIRECFFFPLYFNRLRGSIGISKTPVRSVVKLMASADPASFVRSFRFVSFRYENHNSVHSMHTISYKFTIELNNRRPFWWNIIAFRHVYYKCRSPFFKQNMTPTSYPLCVRFHVSKFFFLFFFSTSEIAPSNE